LKISYLDNIPLLIFLAATIIGTTLLAGAYPAFYISSFNRSSIFRGTLRFGGASLFSRLLMGAQVAISLSAVVVGFSFARNAQVQRQADLGYARESLLGVDNQSPAELKTFQDAINRNPKVIAVAGTRHHVGFGYRRSEFTFHGEKNPLPLLYVPQTIELRPRHPKAKNHPPGTTQFPCSSSVSVPASNTPLSATA